MKALQIVSILLFCIVLVSGCGPKRPEGLPKLYECVLTFQQEDGSPLDGATVSLISDDPALAQWSFAGATDSSGTAKIRAGGDFSGAPTGKFKVVISKRAIRDTGKIDADGSSISEGYSVINEKYSNVGTSPLSVEIANKAVKETFKVEK